MRIEAWTGAEAAASISASTTRLLSSASVCVNTQRNQQAPYVSGRVTVKDRTGQGVAGASRPLLGGLCFGITADGLSLRMSRLARPMGAGDHQATSMRDRIALPSLQGIASWTLDALVVLFVVVLEGVRALGLSQLLDHELAAAALSSSEWLKVQQEPQVK